VFNSSDSRIVSPERRKPPNISLKRFRRGDWHQRCPAYHDRCKERDQGLLGPLIFPPRLAVRRNESLTLRFRAQSVPSRLPRSNSSSVSRGPCATRLHKRNAAGPRCPCPKRSGHKAIPCCLCIHAAQIPACDAPGHFPRNAACLRHHLAALRRQSNPAACAPWVHKLGPETQSRDPPPRAFVCQ